MNPSQTTPRLVPTLTEVLEVSDLQSSERPPGAGVQVLPLFEVPALDGLALGEPRYVEPRRPADLDMALDLTFDLPCKLGPDDSFRAAVLSTVETALAEFRVQLLAKLEPLFETRTTQRSD